MATSTEKFESEITALVPKQLDEHKQTIVNVAKVALLQSTAIVALTTSNPSLLAAKGLLLGDQSDYLSANPSSDALQIVLAGKGYKELRLLAIRESFRHNQGTTELARDILNSFYSQEEINTASHKSERKVITAFLKTHLGA